MMKKFRLPRKTKKSLKGRFWLYPADENGNSLMAHPDRDQGDFQAMKEGIVKDMLMRENREERRAYRQKLNNPITVTDDTLKMYVDDVFGKDFRYSSYQTLLDAKNDPIAIRAYYHFINAYQLAENDDHFSTNICCLAVDEARRLLKMKRKKI